MIRNITRRIKDLIIRGGEYVSHKEIEDFLNTHPGVADVQVIGVPSEKYGEEVMAWVKLKTGHTPTAIGSLPFVRIESPVLKYLNTGNLLIVSPLLSLARFAR